MTHNDNDSLIKMIMTHNNFRSEAKILQQEQINTFLSQLRMTNLDSGLVSTNQNLENFFFEKRNEKFWGKILTKKILGWAKRWTRCILARIGTSPS